MRYKVKVLANDYVTITQTASPRRKRIEATATVSQDREAIALILERLAALENAAEARALAQENPASERGTSAT